MATIEQQAGGPIADYHDREAWLEERRKSIGGSEVAAIFGEHPFLTAHDLWLQKTGRGGEEEVNLAMERGRDLEPIAVRRYELRTGRKTRRVPLKRRDDLPFLHASADRQVLANTGEGDWFTADTMVGEFKVPGYQVFGEIREKGLRPYMILQGQVEALMFGYPRVSFGILHADSYRDLAFDMEADAATQEMIANEAGEWWERCVLKDTPPPEPDYGDLKLPEVEGELTQINDGGWARLAAEWIEAKEIAAEAAALEKLHRDALRGIQEELGAHALQGAGIRTYLSVQDGRRAYKTELDAIAAAKPLDPARVETVLRDELPAEADSLMTMLQDEAGLEMPEITGKPFSVFKPYILKGR